MRNRLLGEEHPVTVSAMNNLAGTYASLGKYTDAEKLKSKVLDLRTRCIGEEHPVTISAMGNLANAYEGLGKYADAEKLKIKVLDHFMEKNTQISSGPWVTLHLHMRV